MKIGEFAKLCNCTVRKIKYYEELGLIKPRKILENGYREYSYYQIDTISSISLLQDQGLSLKDIKEMLYSNNLEERYNLLVSQEEYVDEKIKQLQEQKDLINYNKHEIKQAITFKDIIIQDFNFKYDIKSVYTTNGYIFNYLLQGIHSGMIIDRDGQIKCEFYMKEDGEYRVDSKCLVYYHFGSVKNRKEIYEQLEKYALDHNQKLKNVFIQLIFETENKDYVLVKYIGELEWI